MLFRSLLAMPTGQQAAFVGVRSTFGAAGIFNARDEARFWAMLAQGGELDGVRLLSPMTVRLMHANHTGNKYTGDTHAFGLGFWVNNDLGFFGELGTEGAYGWGSAYFPQYLVDPKEKWRIPQLEKTLHVTFREFRS